MAPSLRPAGPQETAGTVSGIGGGASLKILGADLRASKAQRRDAPWTLVLLDDAGRGRAARHPQNLAELVSLVLELADGEPFLLGANVPITPSPRTARSRPVDNLLRRRLGFRPPWTRRRAWEPGPAAPDGGVLLAALASAGAACLPAPDRDGRKSSVAEIHPGLCLKVLMWESLTLARSNHPLGDEVFRSLSPPSYRRDDLPARAGAGGALASLGVAAHFAEAQIGEQGLLHEAVNRASGPEGVERCGSLLDALLIASTAHRYMRTPESCLFLGDPRKGYTVLPADGWIRRMAVREGAPRAAELFPRTSLREHLEAIAALRPLELVDLPGRPKLLEAEFKVLPVYEFDNVDEMVWWKHCRHLRGPVLPTEGIRELAVRLEPGRPREAGAPVLRLVRSRHRTLSFRFEPPAQWRRRLAPRDGKTYAFEIARAVYAVGEAAGPGS